MTDLLTPTQIGTIAGGLFILAYLIINQIVLRLILIVGTVFYIWYYFVVAPNPLWESIYLSLAMGAANILGLTALMARRSRLAIPAQHADIYPKFRDLPPGDFRALMKRATRRSASELEQITVQGQPLETLTFVISGSLQVEKNGDQFRMPAGVFVGEVAFLNKSPSAASTWIDEGSEILQWDVQTLRNKAKKDDRFRLALESMISKDLAAKVAVAVAPNTATWRDAAVRQAGS